ncbi:class I SAM-dependent methyltransferase [Planctomonas psychrotolerans]|uniref:class I SAM-dependent methyltransferase n=1 Tax=Planctomonas psychrotolerans TaxID=2528712 RepID=UPI00123C5496|nr:class I SAM-dependent methyltransferase [Planctomonas psychrotolerans]
MRNRAAFAPVGSVTRGTTHTNRLRRVDRWIAALPSLRRTGNPVVVDLGYGASGVTTLELASRLARVRPDVRVVGFEIERDRVTRASAQLAARPASAPALPAVRFDLGGFEVPLPLGEQAAVIRAFNVLRQYDESEVAPAWRLMLRRLHPDGVLIDGTCNEIGRVASWVAVTATGPASLTIALRLSDLDRPSVVAERLPKVLIHRNVPGERVHDLIRALDSAWQLSAPLAAYGPTQRWIATVRRLRDAGWPVGGGPARWRLGELTVRWESVAPAGFVWSD